MFIQFLNKGSDIARLAVLDADYDETVPGTQVDRFCASGLEACNIAAAQVMSGQSDLTIGGGVESMSRVPLGSAGGAWMTDPSVSFKTYFVPQGISADLLATNYNYSRDDVDLYAVESKKQADLLGKINTLKIVFLMFLTKMEI